MKIARKMSANKLNVWAQWIEHDMSSLLSTGLTEEKADIVTEHGCVAVEEITCQVDHHRQLGQFLEKLSCLLISLSFLDFFNPLTAK